MACVFQAIRPDLPSSKLLEVAEQAHLQGLSGRALRRIPLLMHAFFAGEESICLADALVAMMKVLGEMGESTSIGC